MLLSILWFCYSLYFISCLFCPLILFSSWVISSVLLGVNLSTLSLVFSVLCCSQYYMFFSSVLCLFLLTTVTLSTLSLISSLLWYSCTLFLVSIVLCCSLYNPRSLLYFVTLSTLSLISANPQYSYTLSLAHIVLCYSLYSTSHCHASAMFLHSILYLSFPILSQHSVSILCIALYMYSLYFIRCLYCSLLLSPPFLAIFVLYYSLQLRLVLLVLCCFPILSLVSTILRSTLHLKTSRL